MLTPEQCEHYRLPRTPIKKSERRAGRFEERFGEGATELDALEALHPGELAKIIESEIERYYDRDLDFRTRQAARPITAELALATLRVRKAHSQEIDELSKEYAEIVAARERWVERAKPLWRAITNEIKAEIEPLVADIDWPEPRAGDEDNDPLFDSTRDYVEQIDRYNEFQGKPTGRKPEQRPRKRKRVQPISTKTKPGAAT